MLKNLETLVKKSLLTGLTLFGLSQPLQAQNKILSIYWGEGKPPIENVSIPFYSEGNPLVNFKDIGLIGVGLGRKFSKSFSVDFGISFAIADAERFDLKFINDYFGKCLIVPLNEEGCYGSKPTMFDITTSMRAYYSFNLSKSDKVQVYFGVGPLFRLTSLSVLTETSLAGSLGVGSSLGIRFKPDVFQNFGALFIEYSYDRTTPSFLNETRSGFPLKIGLRPSQRLVIGGIAYP